MSNSHLFEIGFNDERNDIIRKINYNFKQMAFNADRTNIITRSIEQGESNGSLNEIEEKLNKIVDQAKKDLNDLIEDTKITFQDLYRSYSSSVSYTIDKNGILYIRVDVPVCDGYDFINACQCLSNNENVRVECHYQEHENEYVFVLRNNSSSIISDTLDYRFLYIKSF